MHAEFGVSLCTGLGRPA